jgi:hypothetical protein
MCDSFAAVPITAIQGKAILVKKTRVINVQSNCLTNMNTIDVIMFV